MEKFFQKAGAERKYSDAFALSVKAVARSKNCPRKGPTRVCPAGFRRPHVSSSMLKLYIIFIVMSI